MIKRACIWCLFPSIFAFKVSFIKNDVARLSAKSLFKTKKAKLPFDFPIVD
jgi:hypothetical protein